MARGLLDATDNDPLLEPGPASIAPGAERCCGCFGMSFRDQLPAVDYLVLAVAWNAAPKLADSLMDDLQFVGEVKMIIGRIGLVVCL